MDTHYTPKRLSVNEVLQFIRLDAKPDDIDRIAEEVNKSIGRLEEIEYTRSQRFSKKIHRRATADGIRYTVFGDTRGKSELYSMVEIYLSNLEADDRIVYAVPLEKFDPDSHKLMGKEFLFTHPSVRTQFEARFKTKLGQIVLDTDLT